MKTFLAALPWLAIAGSAGAQTMAPPFTAASAPQAASAPMAMPPQATASAPATSRAQAAAPAAPPAYVPAAPVPPPQPAYVQPPPPPTVARTPAPPAAPTPPVKGLPPDAPRLVVNGGTYSERREMRMAIVNGSVVREGTNVDGVVVEQIRPDGLVLAFRGSRYHVAY